MNESGFDPKTYYISNNIFTRIYSEDVSKTKRILVFSPLMVGECISERVDKMIYRHYRDDGAAILSAVLTGNKHRFSEEYDDVLVSTGFKKVFHPAYLHIFIITSFIGLFRYVIRRQYRDLSTAVILLIYALIQCSSIGFTRCLICTAITIYYRLRYGSSYFPDTISAVIVICALTMPTMLFNTSFIISVSCGLIAWAFVPRLYKKLGFIPQPFRRTVSAMIIFAVVATPVMAYFFSSICIYSFILPLITAPVIILILLISPVYFIMQELFCMSPVIGAYLNVSVRYLYKLPYIIRELPFSSINIGKSSDTFMLMSLCIILSIYCTQKPHRRYVKILKTLSSGFFTAIVFYNVMRIGTAEINFVNVGQGDGAIIHTPYKETVIIDAGGSSEFSEYNTGKELFVPYLYAMGMNYIEAIIVSHYHKDHAEGVINVMQSVRTDTIFMPPIKDADSESMKELAEKIKETARNNGTKVRYITDDTQITFKDGLTLEIYRQPEWLRKYDENNTSLPVMVRYGEFSALFMGDMTGIGESEFVKVADADADVLKVSHHGSSKSTFQEFIDEVSPQTCIISCGEDNLYGHPHKETLDRLHNTDVLRTDLMGDIRISARKSGKYKVSD
jgi:competence protein ComEC